MRDAVPAALVERLLDAGDRIMESDPGLGRQDHEEFGIRCQYEPMLAA